MSRAANQRDGYLWSVRDGCLETWCVWDTGEDNCARFLNLGAKDGKLAERPRL